MAALLADADLLVAVDGNADAHALLAVGAVQSDLAGIDLDGRKLTPHSLRYTYVTKMRRTLPVDTVRKLVGHTAEKMTEYYTRASIEDGLAGIKDTKTAVENLFD